MLKLAMKRILACFMVLTSILYMPRIVSGSSSCNTIAGPRINENCVFPFVFLEKTYNKCTWEGDSSEGAWCSTKVDEFGTHIKGEWGNCAEQCPVEVTTRDIESIMEFDTKYMNSNVNDYDGEQEFDYEHNGHESANKEMDDQRDANRAQEDVDNIMEDSNNRDVKQKMFPQAREHNLEARQETGSIGKCIEVQSVDHNTYGDGIFFNYFVSDVDGYLSWSSSYTGQSVTADHYRNGVLINGSLTVEMYNSTSTSPSIGDGYGRKFPYSYTTGVFETGDYLCLFPGEMMTPIPENSTGVGSSACTSASGSGFVSGLNECKGKCLASSDCNIINFCIEGCSLGANYCDLKSCSGDSYMIVNTYGTYEIYSKMNESCMDMVQNQMETDVDCGGPHCDPCPTCMDGIKNQDEEDVDCGGSNCDPCATCTDGMKNGDEEDIDCGGSNCDPCGTCKDGIKNGDEEDIDCGGSCPCCGCNIFGCAKSDVAIMSSHGKYVQAEIDGTANANAKYRGSLETFKVEEAGNNKVAFAAIHKNKYLVVKDGKDLSASSWKTPQKTEEFLVEVQDDGRYALKSVYGRYVTANADGSLKDTATSAGNLEMFTVECVVPENPAKCKEKLRMKRCARKKANKKCWKSWVKWACPLTCKVCCGNRWIEKKCAKYRHHCATSRSIRKHCRKDCGICTN